MVPCDDMSAATTSAPVRVVAVSADVGGAYCGWLLANLSADASDKR
jgi:hypothetical protein